MYPDKLESHALKLSSVDGNKIGIEKKGENVESLSIYFIRCR